jgi:NodT family efflux transporter outer membrane factor (OMF) lipoprotein
MFGKPVAQNWWTLFESNVLESVIGQAVTSNRTLAASKATLAQFRETVAQARGATWPQLGLDATVAHQRLNPSAQGINAPPDSFSIFSLGPRVSFALDPFGANTRRIEQQTALANAQDFEVGAAWLALTGNAATQVVNIASVRDQIGALQALIADDEQNLALVRRLTDAGEYTQVDVAAANSQLAADRALLPPLRQELKLAEDALSLLLAKAPSQFVPPELSLADIALPQQLPVSLPSQLVHDRPDILAREAELQAASAAIGVATAQLYPDITLSASVTQQALTTAELFSPASRIWNFAGNLTAPVFSGGALQAQKRAAEHAYDAALATYEQTVLQAFTQIADLLYALMHGAELIEEERRAVEAAEATLRLVRTTIAFGDVSLLEVVDAQRQLQRARLGYIRASAQRYRDTIALLVAMGGGAREWRATEAANVPTSQEETAQ